jgi:hypothetical protein
MFTGAQETMLANIFENCWLNTEEGSIKVSLLLVLMRALSSEKR